MGQLLSRMGWMTLVAALAVTAPAAAQTYKAKPWPNGGTVAREAPVLFIHGLDALGDAGTDCRSQWGSTGDSSTMIGRFSQWGHTGGLITVKYYGGDTNCALDIHHHGSHSLHYPSGHTDQGHTAQTDIRHLGYHLAKAIDAHYGSSTNVEVVGHSMGGLMVRYALARIERGQTNFPPFLMIRNAVTMGTPHLGSGPAAACSPLLQCSQMRNGSDFMDWLDSYAQNPQGLYGTNWTLISSENDGWVSQGSGVGMDANHKVIFGEGIGHSDYYTDTSTAMDRNVKYDDGNDGNYFHWNDAPHVVRWADRATATTTW